MTGQALSVKVGSITFPNPVMTASGTVGHGTELAAYCDLGELGAVVVKSLSAQPWAGNPSPRVHGTSSGMINSVGLQNPGIDSWIKEDLPALLSHGARVVVSIWGRTVDEYREAASRLAGVEGITAVEVNVSCPNLESRGDMFAHDAHSCQAAISASLISGFPTWAKLSPNVTDIVSIAKAAIEAGYFNSQIIPIEAPVMDDNFERTDQVISVSRDEVPRDTSLAALAELKPVAREDGLHTAGTSSQIADGAAAVLMMSARKAQELGLKPLATIRASALVGCDPVIMLEGPIPATQKMLQQTDLSIDDIDVFEVNEAFASVVLSWAKEVGADMAKVNPNGGAIALGHPLGATGCFLITKAVYELKRSGGRYGLIAMCCGGGLGTGTLIESAA